MNDWCLMYIEQFFQPYHGQNKLFSDEIMMMFVIFQPIGKYYWPSGHDQSRMKRKSHTIWRTT
jgi:hypothetical protein